MGRGVVSEPIHPPTPSMGAVHASEMAPPQSPPDTDRNPGTVEELHAKWREMLPMPFVGAKLLVQKGLSNNFQVSHALTMSDCIQVVTDSEPPMSGPRRSS